MSDESKIEKILRKRWSDATYFAKGGNSYVYKAKDSEMEIAIKVFRRFDDNGRYERFIQELITVQKLKDVQGIIPILFINSNAPEKLVPLEQVEEVSQLGYFGMPFFDKSLSEELKTTNADDGTLAVQLTLEIANIVSTIHSLGYAHRDLKPENILIEKSGSLLISDFGLSIDLKNIPDPDDRLSEKKELIGSLRYRAPELLRGRLDDSDHKPCDVYSLGRILWTLLWGKEPYNLTDLEFQNMFVYEGERPINKSRMLDDIIKGATNINPLYRLTIDEFINALREWLNNPPMNSVDGIIQNISNSKFVIEKIKYSNTYNEIQKINKETVDYICDELTTLVKNWQKIVVETGKDIGSDISSIVIRGNLSAGMISPEMVIPWPNPKGRWDCIKVSFTLPNPNQYIKIDFSIYIFYHPDNYSMEYFIVPAYFPIGESYVDYKLACEIVHKEFDYRSAGVKQEIMTDAKKAIYLLNEIFMAQF
jgi:serine/threonine protein kinase